MVRDADVLELKNRNYRFDHKIRETLLRQAVDLIEKWHGKPVNACGRCSIRHMVNLPRDVLKFKSADLNDI